MASSFRFVFLLLAACESQVETPPDLDGGGTSTAPDCTEPPRTGALDAAPFVDGTVLVGHALWYPGMQPLLLSVHDLESGEDCVIEGPSLDSLRCVSPSGGASSATVAEMLSAVDRPVRLFEHVGSDGSRFPALGDSRPRFFDEHWQAPCEPTYLYCGQGTCLPPHANDFGFFGDGACSTSVAVTSAGADAPNCGSRARVNGWIATT